MSRRIRQCFSNASKQSRKVLIPFFTAGDPEPDWTTAMMHSLVESGADLLELGIPFSDPMADGPVIQASSERAVGKGVSLETVLQWVREFRLKDQITPVVLMGYLNPFERFGYSTLASESADAGVDGLLLVDCPPEEMQELQTSLDENDVSSIRLVAPTTTDERLRLITNGAHGFIYYVSFKGTTGAARINTDQIKRPVEKIKELSSLPVAVGFGIKDAETAANVAQCADAVVIGSALVSRLASCATLEEACNCCKTFVAPIRTALDQAVTISA